MKYDNFKNAVVAKSLTWYYKETPERYSFVAHDGPLIFECEIYRTPTSGADTQEHSACVADFEANHKASAINIS